MSYVFLENFYDAVKFELRWLVPNFDKNTPQKHGYDPRKYLRWRAL